jgi:2-polyprenyl-3-methyl-5-hydroxy-6-metoxy-1,4-benzoquinol methylase
MATRRRSTARDVQYCPRPTLLDCRGGSQNIVQTFFSMNTNTRSGGCPASAKRTTRRELRRAGLQEAELEEAFADATSLYGNVPIENSLRSRMAAALAFTRNGSLFDVGAYINIYPVVLSLLGLTVTVLDNYAQRRLSEAEREKIETVLDTVYARAGIKVINENAYTAQIGLEEYDVVSAFEVLEHLVDSPRAVVENIYIALRHGGRFVCTVPNIARLGSRLRVLCGRSVLPSYDAFYQDGAPFLGHRREMTIGEVEYMLKRAGFHPVQVSSTMVTVPGESCKSFARRIGETALEMLGPASLRSTLVGIGVKP